MLSLSEAFVVCSKINVLNLCSGNFKVLSKLKDFCLCWSEHFSSMNPQGSLLEQNCDINQLQTKLPLI